MLAINSFYVLGVSFSLLTTSTLSFWRFLAGFIFLFYAAALSMSGLWTEILTDFDPEEETANFGTRLSLVTEGSLYEVPSPL
jgi:hypothetical protein